MAYNNAKAQAKRLQRKILAVSRTLADMMMESCSDDLVDQVEVWQTFDGELQSIQADLRMMDALVKAAIGEMGGKHPENPPTEQVATNIAQTETPHHPGAKPVHPRDKAKPV